MDVERTIQFLLENQAGHDERLAKLETNVIRLATIAEMQIEAHALLTQEVREYFRRSDERQERADERQRLADERQKHSDERLDAVIVLFERFISGK